MSVPADSTNSKPPIQAQPLGAPQAGASSAEQIFFNQQVAKIQKIAASLLVPENFTIGTSTLQGGVYVTTEKEGLRKDALKKGYEALSGMIGKHLEIEGELQSIGLKTGTFSYQDAESGEIIHLDLTQELLKLPQELQDEIRKQATELLHFQDPGEERKGTQALVKGTQAQFQTNEAPFSRYAKSAGRIQSLLGIGQNCNAETQINQVMSYFEKTKTAAEKKLAQEKLELLEKVGLLENGAFNLGVVLSLLEINPDEIRKILPDELLKQDVSTFAFKGTKQKEAYQNLLDREQLIAECKGYSMDPKLRMEFIDFFREERLEYPSTIDLEVLLHPSMDREYTTDSQLREHLKGFAYTTEQKEAIIENFSKIRGVGYRDGLHKLKEQEIAKAGMDRRSLLPKFIHQELSTEMEKLTPEQLNIWSGINGSDVENHLTPAQQKKLALSILSERKALSDLTYEEIRDRIAHSFGLSLVKQATPASSTANATTSNTSSSSNHQPAAASPIAAASSANVSTGSPATKAAVPRVVAPHTRRLRSGEEIEMAQIPRARQRSGAGSGNRGNPNASTVAAMYAAQQGDGVQDTSQHGQDVELEEWSSSSTTSSQSQPQSLVGDDGIPMPSGQNRVSEAGVSDIPEQVDAASSASLMKGLTQTSTAEDKKRFMGQLNDLAKILYRSTVLNAKELEKIPFEVEKTWIDRYKKAHQKDVNLQYTAFVEQQKLGWRQVKRFVANHILHAPTAARETIAQEYYLKGRFNFSSQYPKAYEARNRQNLVQLPSYQAWLKANPLPTWADLDIAGDPDEFANKLRGKLQKNSFVVTALLDTHLEGLKALYAGSKNPDWFLERIKVMVAACEPEALTDQEREEAAREIFLALQQGPTLPKPTPAPAENQKKG